MDYAMKPFTKMLSILPGTEETNILLKDTSGNLVDCNYCEITVEHTPLEAGYVYVRPLTLNYHDGTIDPSGTGLIKSEPGAGALSISAGHKGVIRTVAANSFSSIAIGSGFTSAVNVLINYGFAHAVNPAELTRDKNRGV